MFSLRIYHCLADRACRCFIVTFEFAIAVDISCHVSLSDRFVVPVIFCPWLVWLSSLTSPVSPSSFIFNTHGPFLLIYYLILCVVPSRLTYTHSPITLHINTFTRCHYNLLVLEYNTRPTMNLRSLVTAPIQGHKSTVPRRSTSSCIKSVKPVHRASKRARSGNVINHHHNRVTQAGMDSRRNRAWKACERCRTKKTKVCPSASSHTHHPH
jgi:hypothetical protein